MLLLESPCLQREYSPTRSSIVSSGSYVIHITSLENNYAATVSSPENAIKIFDKSTLRSTLSLSGHEHGTTSLRAAHDLSRESLLSSGKDGCVIVWDVRSNTHAIKMISSRDRALLSCDISPDASLIAAGSVLSGEDAFIYYWDPRQPSTPIRSHTSTHSDDITSLSFFPQNSARNILLSASTDGLLCTSFADEDDEDEAIIQVANWGSSISQAGWIRPSYPQSIDTPQPAIWAASDMETFSTWTSELDRLMNVDIRAPSLHAGNPWSTDYLITAHSSPTSAPTLSVFTGNNEGDVALMSNTNLSSSNAPWCLHKLWKQGHTGIVRGLFWDEDNQVLLTGGEDSRLNSWSIHPLVSDDVELEGEEDEAGIHDTDEIMDDWVDVKMASPKQRKRDSKGNERMRKRAKRHES